MDKKDYESEYEEHLNTKITNDNNSESNADIIIEEEPSKLADTQNHGESIITESGELDKKSNEQNDEQANEQLYEYLKEQVNELAKGHPEENITSLNDNQNNENLYETDKEKKGLANSRHKKIFAVTGIILLVLLLISAWLVFTKSGRKVIYKIAGSVIYQGLEKEEDIEASTVTAPIEENTPSNEDELVEKIDNKVTPATKEEVVPKKLTEPRQEEYVSNYLILGLEEMEHAENADTIMIASINTKDSTIKLTSILRDSYIEMDEYKPNKINAFFSIGGAKTIVKVIEDKYRIKIDGYAYINFESFEKIVDYLGGISIELGDEEASYLNRTNYISNPVYRNVQTGWNLLNGNQALGYCRIRRVETIGGANDDYGRTLRQRRVLKSVFSKYKSKNVIDLLRISDNILGYVKTNVTQTQIEKAIEDVVENKIIKMNTVRIPANGTYEAPKKYNGIGYPLIYDWDENVMELYRFIYLDTDEEARANLEKYR